MAASYISLYLPMSPYISLHLTDLEHALGNLLAALVHAAPAVLGRGLSGRYGEMWGDVGRYGEIYVAPAVLGRGLAQREEG